jgi:hypothetical protein
MNNDVNKPIMDVKKPGNVAANPTSKPVITQTQPTIQDPMVAPSDAPSNINLDPTPIKKPETEPVVSSTIDDMPAGPSAPATNLTPEEFADAAGSQSPQPMPGNSMPDIGQDHANPETGHKLIQDEPTFSQVSSHKRGLKLILISVILLVIAAAMAYYFVILK